MSKYIVTALLLMLLACEKQRVRGQQVAAPATAQERVLSHDEYIASITSDSCQFAIDSAKAEAQKGNYFYTSDGTVVMDEFQQHFNRYMRRKFNIEMSATCTGFDRSPEGCFKQAANTEIEKRFGQSFMDSCYQMQKAKFEVTKPAE